MVALPTADLERELLCAPRRYLAAVDEVGRGALAGPVTVGAVLVGVDFAEPPEGLRDSKLLTAAARQRLVAPIRAWAAGVAVGHASAAEIDRVGIMAALGWAAGRALAGLPVAADIVLLDGTVDFLNRPAALVSAGDVIHVAGAVHTRARADRDCASVAAASIIAKVTRDRLMCDLASGHPHYGWERNKGYGTADHTAAIRVHGVTDLHRRSWRLPHPERPRTVHNDDVDRRPPAGSRVPEGA